jgi:hypothetical protein
MGNLFPKAKLYAIKRTSKNPMATYVGGGRRKSASSRRGDFERGEFYRTDEASAEVSMTSTQSP